MTTFILILIRPLQILMSLGVLSPSWWQKGGGKSMGQKLSLLKAQECDFLSPRPEDSARVTVAAFVTKGSHTEVVN